MSILTLNHVKLHNICDMLLISIEVWTETCLQNLLFQRDIYTLTIVQYNPLIPNPFKFIQLVIHCGIWKIWFIYVCTKKGLKVNSLENCSFMTLCDLFQMSTPHPIKTRLERTPRKQRRKTPLVRSHSMPESLDKLSKRKKFLSTIGMSASNSSLSGA